MNDLLSEFFGFQDKRFPETATDFGISIYLPPPSVTLEDVASAIQVIRRISREFDELVLTTEPWQLDDITLSSLFLKMKKNLENDPVSVARIIEAVVGGLIVASSAAAAAWIYGHATTHQNPGPLPRVQIIQNITLIFPQQSAEIQPDRYTRTNQGADLGVINTHRKLPIGSVISFEIGSPAGVYRVEAIVSDRCITQQPSIRIRR